MTKEDAAWNEALEAAARLVETCVEVFSVSGSLAPRPANNEAGLGYAATIRELKAAEPKS